MAYESLCLGADTVLTSEPCKVASVYSVIGLVLDRAGRWAVTTRSQGSTSKYGSSDTTGFAWSCDCLPGCLRDILASFRN